jgi:hypothetical protein
LSGMTTPNLSKLPAGWSVLPKSVQHKGKTYPVWPDNGRSYVKGNTVVSLAHTEGRTFATVTCGDSLSDEEAGAVIHELLPGAQLWQIRHLTFKMFEVYTT